MKNGFILQTRHTLQNNVSIGLTVKMNNKQETQAAIIPYIYLNKYIYHSNEGKIQGEYPSKFEQYETSN